MSYEHFSWDSSSKILSWNMLAEAGATQDTIHFLRHYKSNCGEETDFCKFVLIDDQNSSGTKVYAIIMNDRKWLNDIDIHRLAERLNHAVVGLKKCIRESPMFYSDYMIKISAAPAPPPPPPTLSDKIGNVLAKIIMGLSVCGYLIVCIFIIAAVVLFCYLLS